MTPGENPVEAATVSARFMLAVMETVFPNFSRIDG